MTATIDIERATGGWVDRFRAYEVFVNGQRRAELRQGRRETIDVESGSVEIHLKIDWCRSRSITLNLNDGQTGALFCKPRSLFTALYGITFARSNYMRLEAR